jgi:hypothetical protein
MSGLVSRQKIPPRPGRSEISRQGMNVEVHGINTKHNWRLWQSSKESLRCSRKERTPSVGGRLYAASKLARLRYVTLRYGLLRGEKL